MIHELVLWWFGNGIRGKFKIQFFLSVLLSFDCPVQCLSVNSTIVEHGSLVPILHAVSA